MKHVHLVLDEALLEEAVKASGERTYTAAVTRGLEELTRLAKIRGLFALAGSGAWEGDLAEMRGDSPRRRARKLATKPKARAPRR
jgi:hypothetical protein